MCDGRRSMLIDVLSARPSIHDSDPPWSASNQQQQEPWQEDDIVGVFRVYRVPPMGASADQRMHFFFLPQVADPATALDLIVYYLCGLPVDTKEDKEP